MKSTKLIFIDTAGSPSLKKIQEDFPYYAAFACMVDSNHYFGEVELWFDEFKLKWFNNRKTILHYRDIQNKIGAFAILTDKSTELKFKQELEDLIKRINFVGIEIMIDKGRLKGKYGKYAYNPTELIYDNILRRICYHLRKNDCCGHIFIEKGESGISSPIKFKKFLLDYLDKRGSDKIRTCQIIEKSEGFHGLQVPDLSVTPIIRYVHDEKQLVLNGKILIDKLERSPQGELKNWGLVIFP